MIRSFVARQMSRTFLRSFAIILIAEIMTVFGARYLLDQNINRWLHSRTGLVVKAAQGAASAAGWSQIVSVPDDRESAIGDAFEKRLNTLSWQYFKHNEGTVFLAWIDNGDEIDVAPGPGSDEPYDNDKANRWIRLAYATKRLTYSSIPVVDNRGTYLAAYMPILHNGKVVGLVGAEYDSASLGDFKSIVRTAFWYSIIPAILISLIVSYILAMIFADPRPFLRASSEAARTQLARSLKGEKDEVWDSLTPREMEIAELASEGLQNKEMAERLFLSPETVKQHLKSISRKTGFTTRQLGLEAQARRIAVLLRAAP